MRLDSIRGLKQELLSEVIDPFAIETNRVGVVCAFHPSWSRRPRHRDHRDHGIVIGAKRR
jgi:hypothetical protein